MEPNRSPPLGSIADVRQRLVLWCERSDSGLARVEFSSEGARRRVVAGLREDLAARGILLHEITLQTVADASALASDLLAHLSTLAPGAVSIDGFASALPLDSAQRREALYRFNLKREPLGEQPQRQIWWLPPHLAEDFIRLVPDLDSWFLVKLQLSEIAETTRTAEAAGDRLGARERGAIDTRLDPAELRSLAATTIERLQRGRQQGLTQAEAQDLLLRALGFLRQGGLDQEASLLAARFPDLLNAYRLFVSAVGSEFRSYRDALRHDLERPGVTVRVQEDFIPTGSETLDKLDTYIAGCDAVIHLVGDLTGALAQPSSLALIRQRYPDLGRRLPPLAPFLEDGAPALSYTQWEAWLALYHGKTLLIAVPEDAAPRDAGYRRDEAQRAAQQAHLARLAAVERHPEIRFANADRLAVELLRSKLHEILARAGVRMRPANLPFGSLGALFKGRDAALADLAVSLGGIPASPSAVVARVINGIGGVGKTRLALEYAWRRADDYSALLFVGAESPAALQRHLAALCSASVLDLPERHETDEGRQYEAVLNWLRTHPGWLLIVDNVDSEDAAAAAEALLPRLAGGHVVLTSRLAHWSGRLALPSLEVLARKDAANFLVARSQERRRPRTDDAALAAQLADELGGLALALEQAGAYIAQRRLNFAEYLAEWHSQREKVLAWYDARLMQYPKSVAITWQTSFDRVGEPARRLLQRLAWLAPEPIPESLLAVAVPEDAGEARATAGAPADSLAALVELESYSLVRRASDAPSFTIHRLLQEVSRRPRDDTAPAAAAALRAALAWVDAAFVGDPGDVRDWPLLDALAPHALAVARYADAAGIADPTARLLNQVGLLLLEKARYAEAEPLLRRALAIDEASLGDAHPKVAIRLNNLAQLLQETNRLAEAEPLMRRALAIDEASFGDAHPNVARDLNNLAQLLKATNRLAEAEPLIRRALAIDEASFGDAHPEVAIDLNNLARLLQDTNRLVEAEPLMRRALAIDEASFGDAHPNVARHLNNLAQLLRATKRLAEAEPLLHRALAIDEASFGDAHPTVAIDLNNLAQLLQATNRLSEAEPLMRRALAIDEASFGDAHPRVAIHLNNLAQLLQATDRLAEAEPLMRRARRIFVASFGSEHPNSQIVRANTVALLQKMGRSDDEIADCLARDPGAKPGGDS